MAEILTSDVQRLIQICIKISLKSVENEKIEPFFLIEYFLAKPYSLPKSKKNILFFLKQDLLILAGQGRKAKDPLAPPPLSGRSWLYINTECLIQYLALIYFALESIQRLFLQSYIKSFLDWDFYFCMIHFLK